MDPSAEHMDDVSPPIRRPVYDAWATIGWGLVCGLVLLATQVVAIVAVVVTRYDSEELKDVDRLAETIPKDGAILGVSLIAAAIVGIVLVLIIIKARRGPSIAEYLALVPLSRRALTVTIIVAAGVYAASDSLTLLLGRPIVPQFMVDAYETRAWTAVLWVAMVVAAPAVEEVFFRGFLFAGLSQSRLGNTGAVVLTAIGWSLMHTQYGSYEIATIFVGGIVLGILRVKTGSLWSPLIMHMLGNLVATTEVAVYVGRGLG
jgi:membrane protease YdiL (CAAX protease family)